MKTFIYLALTAVAALTFAACGNMPANNANAGNATNSNSNANANKASATAPTKEELVALEQKAFEAWEKKDGAYFEAFLAENFVSNMDGKVKTKAEEVKSITESKCDVKSFELSEPQVTPISPDAAVLTTKATVDATCDGQKVPSPVTSATLFVKSGGTWKAAYHNEVPISGANAPADAANANKPASDTNTNAAKPANTSTPKPAATATPKPAATATATPASNTTASTTTTSNSNSNSNSTDVSGAVVAVEKASWDSWKARDQDKGKLLVTDNVTYVQSNGQIFNGNDAVMKAWYGPQCEIKTVNVSDPKAVSILANLAVLTFKGGATGQCDGKPVSDVWGTSIYIKDGDAWKIAYNLETPVKKS